MKKFIHLFLIALAASVSSASAVSVFVNLGDSTPVTQSGYTNWAGTDSSTTGPTALTAGGLTFTLVDFKSMSPFGSRYRVIDRVANIGTYTTNGGNLPNMIQEWWGAASNTSSSSEVAYLTFNIAGLAAGDYTWTSWHRDVAGQTGTIDFDISTNGGSTFTQVSGFSAFDIIDGTSNTSANPATFSFTANGTDSVQIRLTNNWSSVGTETWVVINGFSVESVPEPGIASLFGITSLLVLLSRRRHA